MARFIIFSILFYCVLVLVKSNTNEVENKVDVFWKNVPVEEAKQRKSEIMQKYLNKTANPCENFAQYACGNWLRYNKNALYPVNEVYSAIEKFVISPDLKLDENNEIKTVEEKIKIYYSTCDEDYRKDKTNFDDFLRIFEPYGSAPLWNPNWKRDEFDWMKLAAFAQKIDIPIFFKVDFNILQNQISLDGVSQYEVVESEADRDQYITSIQNILELTGIDSEAAKQTASEIYEIEQKIVSLLRSGALRPLKKTADVEQTTEDFINTYPEVNWKSYFLDLAENNEDYKDFSKKFDVRLDFKNMTRYINTIKPESLANFIVWTVLRKSINSFDSRYRNAYKKYAKIALINGNEFTYENDRCLQSILKYFRAETVFFSKYFDMSNEYFSKMTEDFRETFINDIQDLKWLPEDVKRNIIDDHLKKLKFEINLPSINSVEDLNEVFADLKITPKKYIENFFNLKYFSKKAGLANKFKSPELLNWYNEEMNTLPIEFISFLPSNYNKHFPDAINFGGLGTSIAQNIIKHLPFMAKTDFDNLVIDRRKSLRPCYEKISESSNIDEYAIFILNPAIEKSFKIYQKWSSKYSNNEKLTGFDSTPDQLFFINFVQNLCDFNSFGELRGTNAIMLTLANHKGFVDAFSCPIGSKANPETKCENFF